MPTKDEIRERIKVMQAWVDGEDVELHIFHDDTWVPFTGSDFDWVECDYRIKPKPKEIFVNEYVDGVYSYESEQEAKEEADYVITGGPEGYVERVAVRYREVLENED